MSTSKAPQESTFNTGTIYSDFSYTYFALARSPPLPFFSTSRLLPSHSKDYLFTPFELKKRSSAFIWTQILTEMLARSLKGLLRERMRQVDPAGGARAYQKAACEFYNLVLADRYMPYKGERSKGVSLLFDRFWQVDVRLAVMLRYGFVEGAVLRATELQVGDSMRDSVYVTILFESLQRSSGMYVTRNAMRRIMRIMVVTGGMHGLTTPLKPSDVIVGHVSTRCIDEDALQSAAQAQMRRDAEAATADGGETKKSGDVAHDAARALAATAERTRAARDVAFDAAASDASTSLRVRTAELLPCDARSGQNEVDALTPVYGPVSAQVLFARMRLVASHLSDGDATRALAQQQTVHGLCENAVFCSIDLGIASALQHAHCLSITGDYAGALSQLRRAELHLVAVYGQCDRIGKTSVLAGAVVDGGDAYRVNLTSGQHKQMSTQSYWLPGGHPLLCVIYERQLEAILSLHVDDAAAGAILYSESWSNRVDAPFGVQRVRVQ